MAVPAEVKETETKVVENTDKKQVEETKPQEETQDQINWKRFRETRERERKEKEAADKRAADKEAEATALKAAMEAILNKPHPQGNSYAEQTEETEEQRIERKVQESILKNEQRREEDRRKREIAELPQKLASTYNDFNQVCSQENLDYFQYHHPEMARAFKYAPDSFETWADIYKTMKKVLPNTDVKKEQAKIEKNLSKPQSMSLPGMTQTGDHAPTEMTEKRRQDNWARMQRTMKGAK